MQVWVARTHSTPSGSHEAAARVAVAQLAWPGRPLARRPLACSSWPRRLDVRLQGGDLDPASLATQTHRQTQCQPKRQHAGSRAHHCKCQRPYRRCERRFLGCRCRCWWRRRRWPTLPQALCICSSSLICGGGCRCCCRLYLGCQQSYRRRRCLRTGSLLRGVELCLLDGRGGGYRQLLVAGSWQLRCLQVGRKAVQRLPVSLQAVA
eukprot:COSAG01_NODE_8586_length_2728_cov_10.055915_3_plen_207_part_00